MSKILTLGAITAALVLAVGAAGAAAPTVTQGVLVAPNGMTLYSFDKDAANSGKSMCNGPCATLWPPLMVAAGDAPTGAYSIITRDDGAKQWAYKGKPLYLYQADQKAGDRSGDNFRTVWHIVNE